MKTMTFVDPATGQVTEVWDGRETMRTLVDALAKLQELVALPRNGQAEIHAGPILPVAGRPREATLMRAKMVAQSERSARTGVPHTCAIEVARDGTG